MKLVLFGAGKIGRSFIGQVFSRSGYEVVFVDIFPAVIDALNERNEYNVMIKDDREETLRVAHVRGVLASKSDRVIAEIASADILAVSVGKNALGSVLPLVAQGLLQRYDTHPSWPLDIIIAENMRDSDQYIHRLLAQHLPASYPLNQRVGLVETSIGKMVPIMPILPNDPLTVYAERYNSLIVARNGFKNPLPQVEALAPKENIKAWVDRKLFIHNLGHAAAAYLGDAEMPGTDRLCEVLQNPTVEQQTREVMQQSAAVLRALYPEEFTVEDLNRHIDDLIRRFKNIHLGDTVYRVGADLTRKLRRDDRLLVPILSAIELQLPYDKILTVFTAGMRFRATDAQGKQHPNDTIYRESIDRRGIKNTLIELSMLNNEKENGLIREIEHYYRRGIISMGNWLVDIVKFIDHYPQHGNLTTIRRIEVGAGGCSHNVLVDLAKLNTGLPLYAGGCIGNDANGEYILQLIRDNHIDGRFMTVTNEAATSYTDVMTELHGGGRTFFHYRGANALLGNEHFEAVDSPARIFHLGYLLLLDRLDEADPEYGRVAARVLHRLQQMGYKTSVDVVSEQGDRFRDIVLPCLPYIDYLIVNEVEAGACCGMELRDAEGEIRRDRVEAAARKLVEMGVKETVAVHFPEGGYGYHREGESCFEPTLWVDKTELLSSVGAGDAFCAGMLYALHEKLPLREGLVLANTSARFNLFHETSTGGAPTLEQIREFIDTHGLLPPSGSTPE